MELGGDLAPQRFMGANQQVGALPEYENVVAARDVWRTPSRDVDSPLGLPGFDQSVCEVMSQTITVEEITGGIGITDQLF